MTRLYAEGLPINVTTGADGAPLRFQFKDQWFTVEMLANRWRVATDWWKPEARAEREYFKIVAGDMLCTIYRDLLGDGWYMSRVYD